MTTDPFAPRQRLDERFPWPSDAPLLGDLRAMTQAIEAELSSLRGFAADWQAEADKLVELGLDWLNQSISHYAEEIQALTTLGFLVATSDTPNTLTEGNQVVFVVPEGPQRTHFMPTAFISITRRSTPDDFATARVVDYAPDTGVLIADLMWVVGDPGPHDDWEFSITGGVVNTLHNDVLAIQDIAVDAPAVHEDRVAAEDAAAAALNSAAAAAQSAAEATDAAGVDLTVYVKRDGTQGFTTPVAIPVLTPADPNGNLAIPASWTVKRDGTVGFTGPVAVVAPATPASSHAVPASWAMPRDGSVAFTGQVGVVTPTDPASNKAVPASWAMPRDGSIDFTGGVGVVPPADGTNGADAINAAWAARNLLSFTQGQTLDATQKSILSANLGSLIQPPLPLAHGQCRLKYVSPTEVRLYPHSGDRLFCNGKPCSVPLAGIALTNAGLPPTLTTTNRILTSNVVTLTFASVPATWATAVSGGGKVGVAHVGGVSNKDGTRSLSAQTATTLSFPLTAANETTAADANGKVYPILYAYAADANNDQIVDTLEWSWTGYVLGAGGIFTKSGDPSRTLVAMFTTTSQAEFADSPTQRFVRSFFNPLPAQVQPAALGANIGGVSATSPTEVSSFRTYWLQFAHECGFLIGTGSMFCAQAQGTHGIAIYLDGDYVPNSRELALGDATVANYTVALSAAHAFGPDLEGFHWGSLGFNVGTSQSGTITSVTGLRGIIR